MPEGTNWISLFTNVAFVTLTLGILGYLRDIYIYRRNKPTSGTPSSWPQIDGAQRQPSLTASWQRKLTLAIAMIGIILGTLGVIIGYSLKFAISITTVQLKQGEEFKIMDEGLAWIIPLGNPNAGILASITKNGRVNIISNGQWGSGDTAPPAWSTKPNCEIFCLFADPINSKNSSSEPYVTHLMNMRNPTLDLRSENHAQAFRIFVFF